MEVLPGDAKRLTRCTWRVLVAEDDVETMQLISWGLRLHGYQVDQAASGTELFERLTLAMNDGTDLPDVILSDVRMPGFSGLEALTCISRAELDIPFVLMSAFSDEETRQRGANDGAAAFLSKPFEFEELLGVIAATLGQVAAVEPPAPSRPFGFG